MMCLAGNDVVAELLSPKISDIASLATGSKGTMHENCCTVDTHAHLCQ